MRRLVVDVHGLKDREASFGPSEMILYIRRGYVHFGWLGVHSSRRDVLAALTPIDESAMPDLKEYRQLLQCWRNRCAQILDTFHARAVPDLALRGTRARDLPKVYETRAGGALVPK